MVTQCKNKDILLSLVILQLSFRWESRKWLTVVSLAPLHSCLCGAVVGMYDVVVVLFFEVISVLSHFLGESEKLRSPIYSVFMWRWPISHIICVCVLYMFIRLKVNHIRNLIHIMSLFGKLCEYYALLTCSVGFSIQIYRGNGCHVYYFVSFITYFVFTHSCQQQKCLHLTQTRIHAISSQVTFM